MKDITTYIKEANINEAKKLSEDEYSKIVHEAIYEYFDGDMDKAIKELEKYDFDMDIILDTVNRGGKLPETAKLIDAIKSYLDDYFPKDAQEHYENIIYNLDKYIY